MQCLTAAGGRLLARQPRLAAQLTFKALPALSAARFSDVAKVRHSGWQLAGAPFAALVSESRSDSHVLWNAPLQVAPSSRRWVPVAGIALSDLLQLPSSCLNVLLFAGLGAAPPRLAPL